MGAFLRTSSQTLQTSRSARQETVTHHVRVSRRAEKSFILPIKGASTPYALRLTEQTKTPIPKPRKWAGDVVDVLVKTRATRSINRVNLNIFNPLSTFGRQNTTGVGQF